MIMLTILPIRNILFIAIVVCIAHKLVGALKYTSTKLYQYVRSKLYIILFFLYEQLFSIG